MKIKHKIDDFNYLNFIGIGSVDKLTVNEPDEFDFENESQIEQIPIINQRSRTFGLSWKRFYKNKNGFFNLSVSNNRLDNRFERFQNQIRLFQTFLMRMRLNLDLIVITIPIIINFHLEEIFNYLITQTQLNMIFIILITILK